MRLTCHLPGRLEGSDSSVGFLDLGTDSFSVDRSAQANAASYAWTAKRWLDVAPELISPNGLEYAYGDTTALHVVDLRSGSDRIIASNPPASPLEFDAAGIYLTKYGAYAGHLGLWRVDPNTESTTQLLAESVAFDQLGGGYAWYIEPRSEGPSPSTIYRIEFGTGARQIWYQQSRVPAYHLGTTPNGTPLIGWTDPDDFGHSRLLLVPTAQQASVLYDGRQESTPWIIAVADPQYGLWFRSMRVDAPLWLMQPDGRIVVAAAEGFQPLGICA